MSLIPRYLACAAAGALVACGGTGDGKQSAAPATEEKILNIYNWTDYIGDTTIADFEARTGIKVSYDTYDSNEILETKMLTGRSGYDLVVPSGTPAERQIKAGVYQKLDKARLPNLANMDPEIMRHIAVNDPGNAHAINYMWGTVGIGYNTALVRKALGTDRIDSWAALFDPAIASKLEKCGIAILNAPEDLFMAARIYLGRDVNSEKSEDLEAATEMLMKVRPYVRYFSSSQYVNDLASGDICIALGWNGLVLQARDRGAAAAKPVEIAYAIPKEGSYIWFDLMAIPADAPHPGNAHAFLNYLMEPAVIAKISDQIGYANGNSASLRFLSEGLRNDPAVYPPKEIRDALLSDIGESPEYMRAVNRAFTRVKSGQ